MELFAYIEASARQLIASSPDAAGQSGTKAATPDDRLKLDAADDLEAQAQPSTPTETHRWEDDAMASSWWV